MSRLPKESGFVVTIPRGAEHPLLSRFPILVFGMGERDIALGNRDIRTRAGVVRAQPWDEGIDLSDSRLLGRTSRVHEHRRIVSDVYVLVELGVRSLGSSVHVEQLDRLVVIVIGQVITPTATTPVNHEGAQGFGQPSVALTPGRVSLSPCLGISRVTAREVGEYWTRRDFATHPAPRRWKSCRFSPGVEGDEAVDPCVTRTASVTPGGRADPVAHLEDVETGSAT